MGHSSEGRGSPPCWGEAWNRGSLGELESTCQAVIKEKEKVDASHKMSMQVETLCMDM